MLRFALILLLASPAAAVRVSQHTVDDKPVVVVQPDRGGPYPVVYLLPGMGEMVRGPLPSARGWVDDYGLVQAFERVQPKGLVLVCPATPKSLSDRFERFLFEAVIPWAEAELPVLKGPKHRALDGISLGGRHALRIGLKYPERFAAIGTEQAAAGGLASLARRRIRADPARFSHLKFHLLTSERDGFRPKIERLHRTLTRLGVHSDYRVTRGRHDKVFARGPGAEGMLKWHDRVLRRP